MQWLRRFLHPDPRRIPEALWQACVARLPFLQRLTKSELDRLKALSESILDTKTFSGAAGFAVTDDIALQVAVQAALPILELTPRLYDDMAGVIIYPAAFLVPQTEVDEAGVVHEWREPLSGEAIGAGGAVVLSSEDVTPKGNDDSIVIHEFVHKIDMADGSANGCPPFLAAFHQGLDRDAWKTVFSAAYTDLQRRLAEHRLHPVTRNRLPLDPYAARNPAEFFAVASETFFVQPRRLADGYPDVYALLSNYYRQDPLPA